MNLQQMKGRRKRGEGKKAGLHIRPFHFLHLMIHIIRVESTTDASQIDSECGSTSCHPIFGRSVDVTIFTCLSTAMALPTVFFSRFKAWAICLTVPTSYFLR